MPISTLNRHMWALFGVVCLLVFLKLHFEMGWATLTAPDSATYMEFPQSWAEQADSIRTIGYKVFLAGLKLIDPGLHSLGIVQLGIAFFVCALLLNTLRSLGATTGFSLSVVLPLVIYQMCLGPGSRTTAIMTDNIATSVTILITSLLLQLIHKPERRTYWIGLMVAVAVGYHVRPSLQILIVLIPALSWVLFLLAGERDFRRIVHKTLLMSLICLTPWILYCGARKLTTGQFALVPFSGVAASGTVFEFLDDEVVAGLKSSELKEFAQEFRDQRAKFSNEFAFDSQGRFSAKAYADGYSINVFWLGVPIGHRLFRTIEHPFPTTLLDQKLGIFTREVIAARPQMYIALVKSNVKEFIKEPRFRLLAVACIALIFISVFGPSERQRNEEDRSVNLHLGWMLGVFAVSFAGLNTLLTSTVALVDQRYIDAAFFLIPSMLSAVIYHRISNLNAEVKVMLTASIHENKNVTVPLINKNPGVIA